MRLEPGFQTFAQYYFHQEQVRQIKKARTLHAHIMLLQWMAVSTLIQSNLTKHYTRYGINNDVHGYQNYLFNPEIPLLGIYPKELPKIYSKNYV